MTETTDIAVPPATANIRFRAMAVFAACTAVLGVASALKPDPRGFGTHQQLGLPPCISEEYLGIPCPLCGMTTSFTLMADARPVDAFHAQPAGAFFFVATVLIAAGAASTAITGHMPGFLHPLLKSRILTGVTIVVMLSAWAFKFLQLTR